MSTAILIPAMRGHLLPDLIANIHEATPEDHEVLVIGTASVIESVVHVTAPEAEVYEDEGGTWGHRLNYLYRCTDAEYLFCGADDLRFHPGWLSAALSVMTDIDGVVTVNDLISDFGTLPLVSRHYLETMGGTADATGAIIHEGYHHNFSERELIYTATARGRFVYCPESVVEHLHWMAGKAERSDPVYQLGESRWNEDMALFQRRAHFWEPQ